MARHDKLYCLDDHKCLVPVYGSRRILVGFNTLAQLFELGLVANDEIRIRTMTFGPSGGYRFQNVMGCVTQVQSDAIFISAHGRCFKDANNTGLSSSAKYTLSTDTLEVTMFSNGTFATVSGVVGTVTDGYAIQWDDF